MYLCGFNRDLIEFVYIPESAESGKAFVEIVRINNNPKKEYTTLIVEKKLHLKHLKYFSSINLLSKHL